MMYSRAVGQSKGTKQVKGRIARALFGMLLWPALLGGEATLSAQEPKPPAKQVPTARLHNPLAGKACVDCHRRVASIGVKCLLAKEDFCEFCHEVPFEGGPARLVKASEPLCLKCHKKDQFKGKFAHGPFAVGACTACHDPHGGTVPAMLRTRGSQVCLECHKDMHPRLANTEFRHKAAVDDCAGCHSPHASELRYHLRAAVPAVCAKCHEKLVDDLQKAVSKHSATTEAPACMNCHSPHISTEGKLLLADGVDICLKCHDKPVKAGEFELANMKELLAKNPVHHGPIQARDCAACHNPHSSPIFRLLASEYPKDFYAPFFESNYALCFGCHESTLVKEERTTTTTGFRDGDRNLHFVHVDRASRGRTCRSCHEVHASVSPKYIAETVPFGDWKLQINFSKTEGGGGCEPGCHPAKKYDRQAASK